jgi:hypothetical protein
LEILSSSYLNSSYNVFLKRRLYLSSKKSLFLMYLLIK